MSPPRRLLQICPHDSAPFGDLIQVIGVAGAAVDVEVTNVFLSPPSDQPLPGCQYLNIEQLSDTKALAAALSPIIAEHWSLVLCHRYRAYWGAVRAGVKQEQCVVLAHEYGLLKKWQRRLGRRWFAPKVHFAGVSKPVAEELALVTDHSVVLPNVIDVQALRQGRLSRGKALAELGLTQDGPVIGMVGRLHYKKRPELGLQAFRVLQQEVPKARLVIMGDGELRHSLQSGAGGEVYFTGNVPNARHYMSAFDVLLYPAVADSFGMVVLEAMDAGVPVVTENAHGPGYVLGELGVYARDETPAAYALAMQQALEVDRAEWLQRCQAMVEQRFSVSAMARMLDHLLIEGVEPGW